jgi:hypothetical protein
MPRRISAAAVLLTLQVSLTVTGDTAYRATDRTYRLDTPSARSFPART